MDIDSNSQAQSTYFQGIGQIVFIFQLARWNIVELGNLLDPSFIHKEGSSDFVNVADDFSFLSKSKPEWKELSSGFKDASNRFSALLACTPYTAAEGQQWLGSSDAGKYFWSDKLVAEFVKDLQLLSSTATNLSASFSNSAPA
jgi:hypothetical protein